jgi:hypothetical protein
MTNSTIYSNNLKQVVNRFIFVAVLLTSVNVLAQTPVTPVYDSMQDNDVNVQSTSRQAVDPYKAVNQRMPVYGKSSRSKPDNTRKVFRDDYERILGTVSKPRETKMVWLGQQSKAD